MSLIIFRSLPFALLTSATIAVAAPPPPTAPTALKALKVLPSAAQKSVVLVQGRGGEPAPQSWVFITRDITQPEALHTYTVEGGEVVADKPVEAADAPRGGDAISVVAVKIDSDAAHRSVKKFIEANHLEVAEIDYALERDGVGAIPLWTLTLFDAGGNAIASLTLAATTGAVIANQGFFLAPAAGSASNVGQSASSKSKPASSGGEESSGIARPFKKVGGKLQKFFTGKDTISK